MVPPREDPLRAWRSIVALVEAHVEGLDAAALDARDGDALTARETVHHVVEANVVAASIVIAALGSPGCVYDWSWMMPFGEWLRRLRYGEKPIEPALALLRALNDWVASQVELLDDGLQRQVLLREAPGAEPRAATVAELLLQEAAHARQHCGARRGRAT